MLMGIWECVWWGLDLSFDVDKLEGRILRVFPESVVRFHLDVILLLFKEFLSAMIEDELCRFCFGFESELFGDEAQSDGGFVPGKGQYGALPS